ncbi:DUF6077 domain-containing protein [Bradyrhizobium sp. DOA1]|uniref:DUF6077 domain-containing protein n=1 Tax=Bradyrhizobium sp. DOA1 TaxID=1126616 RepID=UPI0012E9843F|nr:DUF6077 domain-containing protein [Bradyrhizobium sp. DOA1]
MFATLQMSISEVNFRDRTIALLSIPVLYFVWFIALSASGFFVGLGISATFRSVAAWVAASFLLALIPVFFQLRGIRADRRERIDVIFAACVLLLCTATGFLASSINRPNEDDSVYATKAVFYQAYPNQILDKKINWIEGLPSTAELISFQYYETILAAVANLFDLPFLDVYHVIAPAIVGFLMVLATLLALSVFEQRRGALALGLLLFSLVTLSLGETDVTFGNYSIARAFQGKVFFIAVGLPAWLYLSLRFLTLREFGTWLFLVATGVCFMAATTTALVLLPLFSAVIFLSYICCGKEIFTRKNVELGLAYVSSLAPVAWAAWELHAIAQRSLGTGSPVSTGFPLTFSKQIAFFVNPHLPLTPILFCAALFVTLCYSPHRRFFAIWVAVIIAAFLNPLVFRFMLKTVAPETIYWRLIFLLPFPIVVVTAFFATRGRPRSSAIAIAAFSVLALAVILGPTSVIRKKPDMTLGWPGVKIAQPELSAVREIAETVPAGSMLAPIPISSNLLIYSPNYRQFHTREDFFVHVARQSGVDQLFLDRSSIYSFIYEDSKNPAVKELLNRILASPGRPQVVVLPDRTVAIPEIRGLLERNNYAMRHLASAPYALFIAAPL